MSAVVLARAMGTRIQLTREEAADLARAGRQNDLVVAYLPLAARVAAARARLGGSYDDAFQDATEGLLEAAQRFDPERGVLFGTYATWWLKARVDDQAQRMAGPVRTGTGAKDRRAFTWYGRKKLEIEARGDLATVEAIADAIGHGVSAELVELVGARIRRADVPLDAPTTNHDGVTNANSVPSDAPSAEEVLGDLEEDARRRIALAEVVAALPPRLRKIIRARFPAHGESKTLAEIGAKLGVSRERARQLEAIALKQIREAMTR